MEYESPVLGAPESLYETPVLLDLEDVSAEDPCCDTGGGSCPPLNRD